MNGKLITIQRLIDKMKKIFIGTVSSNAVVSAYYLSSMFKSQEVLNKKNIDCYFDIIIDEPILELARNRLLSIFIESDCDELILIDSDQAWEPEDLMKLVNSDKDFIGAPVMLKTENRYNVSFKKCYNEDIMEVDYVGTGFLKISKKVAKQVFDVSKKYNSGKDAMAFEIMVFDDRILSEDFSFCKKWKSVGGKIFIDTTINPYHIGNSVIKGNFKEYISNMLKEKG
jgi:hypothetical protein